MKNQGIASPEKVLSKRDLTTSNAAAAASPTRRKFIGQIGAALAGGAVLGKAAITSAQDSKHFVEKEITLGGGVDPRIEQSYARRVKAATRVSEIPVPPHTTNGDEARYADKSGTYSKGILQDGIGLVNPAAFVTFRNAINTGTFEAFENVITGGSRTQNGPLGSYAYFMEGCDGVQLGNAASPANQISQIVVHPRRPSQARTMGPNWWNFTGLRCSGISRSPITLQIPSPCRLRPS